MANTTRTVKLYVTTDTDTIGRAATEEDLDAYARNLAAEVESRFEVRVDLIRGACSPSTSCNDEEIDDWLQDIEGTDEWMRYLPSIADSLESLDAAEAMARANELCPESRRDQNWEMGATTWEFTDGSQLQVCGEFVKALLPHERVEI